VGKQEHVPETRDHEVKPNRAQRRHPERIEDAPITRAASDARPATPPVEPDPRAKSSGHKKKTADKWNQ
jgi:hypothetical protein